MTELDDAKDALYELGWSEYESKTYSALVLLKQATASKIAKTSNVPPNRVYQILGQLAENGVVQKVTGEGGTTQYMAVPPQTVLQNYMERYSKKIEAARVALEELTERQDYSNPPTTITIFGRREMNHYIHKMIEDATQNIFIAVDTLTEIKHAEITELLNERSSDIDIKILTVPSGVNNEYEKDVKNKLSDDIKFQITENEFSTIFIIKDEDTILHTVWGYNELEANDIDYYGIYTYDVRTTQMFYRAFMNDWKKNNEDVTSSTQPKGPTME